ARSPGGLEAALGPLLRRLLAVLCGRVRDTSVHDANRTAAVGPSRHPASLGRSDTDARPKYGDPVPGFTAHAPLKTRRPGHDARGTGGVGAFPGTVDRGRAGLARRGLLESE